MIKFGFFLRKIVSEITYILTPSLKQAKAVEAKFNLLSMKLYKIYIRAFYRVSNNFSDTDQK